MAKRVEKETKEIPESFEEVSELIKKLGDTYREHDKIEADYKTKIENLKAESSNELKKFSDISKNLEEQIFSFMEVHRDEIVSGDKKSKDLVHGIIGFRTSPLSVKITDVEGAIKIIKEQNLNQFIRIKEEIDKEAMLKEQELAETIPNVEFIKKEQMYVKTSETQLEITQNLRKK